MTENNNNDIREIRKVVIQNLNSVHSLESLIKTISKSLSKRENSDSRKIYILMIALGVIIILAFYFYFSTEVSRYKDKMELMMGQQQYLKKDIKELKEKLFAIENNDIKAYNLYIALKEKEPEEAIKQYGNFNLSVLSRLERLSIDHEVNLIRQKAAVIRYNEGNSLFKRKSYQAAISKFRESLKISSTGDHISTLFYQTAMAQYRLKLYDKAAITFERFLFVNTEQGFTNDKAELLLGVCYDKMKQYDRALNFYKQVLIENKYTRFKPTIKDRIKILQKKLFKQARPEEK